MEGVQPDKVFWDWRVAICTGCVSFFPDPSVNHVGPDEELLYSSGVRKRFHFPRLRTYMNDHGVSVLDDVIEGGGLYFLGSDQKPTALRMKGVGNIRITVEF